MKYIVQATVVQTTPLCFISASAKGTKAVKHAKIYDSKATEGLFGKDAQKELLRKGVRISKTLRDERHHGKSCETSFGSNGRGW